MEESQVEPGASVVEVRGLTRRFRSTVAIDSMDLTIPRGCVFGLLGENGAGKTTLIKHFMGLLKAQEGTVRVFGKDPIKDPEGVLSRIGYMSEQRDVPGWMRVEELMQYTQGFFPGWDEEFAADLLESFELLPSQRIKTLSMGQTAKICILVALAHKPDLVILDEPSSGLDAVVRKHILDSAIRTVAAEGRTVLFSSHLLDEVERVSDYVAIMNRGRILLFDKLDVIKDAHIRLELAFADELSSAPELDGAFNLGGEGKAWTVLCDGNIQKVKEQVVALNAQVVAEERPTLEEIFLVRVGAKIQD